MLLALLAVGLPAAEPWTRLTRDDAERGLRQVEVVSAAGDAAAFTGDKCYAWAGHVIGDDQFFRIEEGAARFVFNGEEKHLVRAGDAVVVPAGTYHNVINTSSTKPLKLYTVYTPPQHPDGTVHKTKTEADAAEHH